MTTVSTNALADLYLKDETAWLEAMAELIRLGQTDALDFANLREYLSDMAKRDRREVECRLVTLCTHILNWLFQPEHRSKSWERTVITQRHELQGLIEGVLRQHADDVLEKVYVKAIQRAAVDTGLSENEFPKTCPYSINELVFADPLAGNR